MKKKTGRKQLQLHSTRHLPTNNPKTLPRRGNNSFILIFCFLARTRFTANNKFTNWEQYFFICFANGRSFYVYLKSNLIAFEFVSFLLSRGFPVPEKATVKVAWGEGRHWNRDIIATLYFIILIYSRAHFTCFYLDLCRRGWKKKVAKNKSIF